MSSDDASGQPSLAQRTTRLLTTRYVAALAAVAVLSLAGQALVQVALSRQANDARVINLAGRQRNYSQALCKGAVASAALDGAALELVWRETEGFLDQWNRVHRGLRSGDPVLGLSPASPEVRTLLDDLEPRYRELEGKVRSAMAVRRLDLSSVAPLLEAQRSYLVGMEAVVSQLDQEARERVRATRILEASLYMILSLVLIIEVVFVFSPAVRRIREEIEARERTEDAAIEREVAEVSGRLERRIGQDLHDGLGQVLTGISFQAKALQRRLGNSPDASAAEEISQQVAQAIATTRNLARLLHPVDAHAEGLGAAMRSLGTVAEKVFGVAASVEWDDDLPIPEPPMDGEGEDETPPAMHLYRIAQEAVSNAIRHGQATSLKLRGAFDGNRGRLTISDNGIGFDPPTDDVLQRQRSGMGLRIMAYRAQRLGGTCLIRRNHDQGMELIVTWPLPPPVQPT